MSEKEQVDLYIIPPNFAEEGTILSGRIRTRNACEAVLMVLFLLRFILALPLSDRAKIYAGIIVLFPAAIFSILGIHGESLTVFIYHFFQFLFRRRILSDPDAICRLQRNRRMRKRERLIKMQQQKKSRRGGEQDRQRGKRFKRKAESGKTSGEGTKKER